MNKNECMEYSPEYGCQWGRKCKCDKASSGNSDLLNALQVIDSYSCHIFDNVDSFLERFFDGQLVRDLVDVYFAPSELKVYYVLDCGQHITTTVSIADYLSWLESI